MDENQEPHITDGVLDEEVSADETIVDEAVEEGKIDPEPDSVPA